MCIRDRFINTSKHSEMSAFFLKFTNIKKVKIMISKTYLQTIQNELQNIKNEGLFKTERIITSQQSAEIEANGKKLLNFCANNYLGLSNNAEVMNCLLYTSRCV